MAPDTLLLHNRTTLVLQFFGFFFVTPKVLSAQRDRRKLRATVSVQLQCLTVNVENGDDN